MTGPRPKAQTMVPRPMIPPLKKQIRASINKKAYKEDDSHIDLKNTTDSELDAIEICFREKED